MFILLLTVLAIASCFIIAGLWFSSRPSESMPRTYEIARNGRMRRVTHGNRFGRQPVVGGLFGRNIMGSVLLPINVRRFLRPVLGEQSSWVGMSLILLSLTFFGLMLFHSVFPNPSLVLTGSLWGDNTTSAGANKNATSSTPNFPGVVGASKALTRLGQLDVAQYNSPQDHATWAYSACSAASMTEVINAYGHTYRIADILRVEASLKAITPQLGLLEPRGIDRTVDRFGFNATHLNSSSYDQIVDIANRGRPVIISFPPDRWAGGHILVLRGGNNDSAYLADSSNLNMQVMARKVFMKYWGGFAVVVTPK